MTIPDLITKYQDNIKAQETWLSSSEGQEAQEDQRLFAQTKIMFYQQFIKELQSLQS